MGSELSTRASAAVSGLGWGKVSPWAVSLLHLQDFLYKTLTFGLYKQQLEQQ